MITQLKDEGVKAFAAFKLYIEMGDKRNQDAVAKKLGYTSRTLIGRWAMKYKWTDRLKAHFAQGEQLQSDALSQAALEAARENQRRMDSIRETAWEFAQQLFEKARTMLQFPLVRQEITKEEKDGKGRKIVTTIVNPVGWRMADAARMADTADSLARLATGMATGNFNHRHAGPDGGPLPSNVIVAPVINVTMEETPETRAIAGKFHARAS